MNTRLKQFLSAENISQSQFADAIKVVRASVSHVLSGRNNPGYDFIKAIMLAYPKLNIEWLMLGKGKMYKEAQENNTLFQDIELQSPVPEPETEILDDDMHTDSAEHDLHFRPAPIENSCASPQRSVPSRRNVKKVIIFFDDETYQEM